MGYDDVIEHLGSFGRYQKRIYFLICLPAISCAFHKLAGVFLLAKPNYRCLLPFENENNATYNLPPDLWAMSYPVDSLTTKYSTCQYLDSNFTEEYLKRGVPANQSVRCDKWVYDHSRYESTTVTEWDMVCNWSWLTATSDALFMVGVLLGSIIFGHLSDKYGRKPIFFASLAIQLVFGITAAISPEYITYTLSRIVIGATTSGVFLVAYVIAMETVGPSHRLYAGVICMMFFSVGYVLTAGFAYFLTNWRYLQIALTLPGVLFMTYHWFIPESARWLISKGKKEAAMANIQKAAKENKVTIPQDILDNLLTESDEKKDDNIEKRAPDIIERNENESPEASTTSDELKSSSEVKGEYEESDSENITSHIGSIYVDDANSNDVTRRVDSLEEIDDEKLNENGSNQDIQVSNYETINKPQKNHTAKQAYDDAEDIFVNSNEIRDEAISDERSIPTSIEEPRDKNVGEEAIEDEKEEEEEEEHGENEAEKELEEQSQQQVEENGDSDSLTSHSADSGRSSKHRSEGQKTFDEDILSGEVTKTSASDEDEFRDKPEVSKLFDGSDSKSMEILKDIIDLEDVSTIHDEKKIFIKNEAKENENNTEEATHSIPEDELLPGQELQYEVRSRKHVNDILYISNEEKDLAIDSAAEVILRDLRRVYEISIKPLETLYKYQDLSNRHYGDSEIFSKPLILFMGPWSGGKSTIINYLTGNENTEFSLRSGAEPSPAYFNIVMYGDEFEMMDGAQLVADWTFSGLQKFGQGLEERLHGIKLRNELLKKVNIVEIPGILEVRKQVSRLFPFNDACQWFIDRADVIFLVYDPAKLDVGPETEAILDQLKGREYQTRIILNKADRVKPEELLRVQSALMWNISPLMSSAQPPIMYTVSLWSKIYEPGAPTRLLQAQENALLKDLRGSIDKRIENKIASARRFSVRVRNHAKMVDCYLTTYYNHKSLFGNKKRIADQIIDNPQNYHIYEGLSTLTNISRYDLPDPDIYRDFFRLNPLFEFKKLSETCTYFRGCPINKLDVAIAYDLPELIGKYKKMIESSLPN